MRIGLLNNKQYHARPGVCDAKAKVPCFDSSKQIPENSQSRYASLRYYFCPSLWMHSQQAAASRTGCRADISQFSKFVGLGNVRLRKADCEAFLIFDYPQVRKWVARFYY
jgi:hypothetical protein